MAVDAFSSNYQNFINNPQYDYNDDQSPTPVSAVQKAYSFSGFDDWSAVSGKRQWGVE